MRAADYAWPPEATNSQKDWYLRHLPSADLAIGLCAQRRTAVQAGGNIGLWPRRMAASFTCVVTFEPDPASLAVLRRNVAGLNNVEVRSEALGAGPGACAIKHRGLASHRVVDGDQVTIIALDSLDLANVDLLQLDIEGYEMRALQGALETIRRSRPIIQVELRGFTEKYGDSDAAVVALLEAEGYREAGRVPGADVVFTHGR